jgi:hypothetical protein
MRSAQKGVSMATSHANGLCLLQKKKARLTTRLSLFVCLPRRATPDLAFGGRKVHWTFR